MLGLGRGGLIVAGVVRGSGGGGALCSSGGEGGAGARGDWLVDVELDVFAPFLEDVCLCLLELDEGLDAHFSEDDEILLAEGGLFGLSALEVLGVDLVGVFVEVELGGLEGSGEAVVLSAAEEGALEVGGAEEFLAVCDGHDLVEETVHLCCGDAAVLL